MLIIVKCLVDLIQVSDIPSAVIPLRLALVALMFNLLIVELDLAKGFLCRIGSYLDYKAVVEIICAYIAIQCPLLRLHCLTSLH